MAKKAQEIMADALKPNGDPSLIEANKQVLMNAFSQQKTSQGTINPTDQPQATSQADVEAQDSSTRLWQSLQNSYDYQRKQSNESYDQAISQADRQLQSRGMGRSSYAGQALANMQGKKIEAENQITNNQIADYQNRLNTLQQQEKEDERWERQFSYQQERDKIADDLAERQFAAQQEQWKQQFDYNAKTTEQQIAYNYIVQMLEKGDNPSDALLKQAGISRKDYNQMKTSAKKTGSGGRGGSGGGNKNGNGTTNDPWAELNAGLNANVPSAPNRNSVKDNVGYGTEDDMKKKNSGGAGTRYNLTK